MAYIPQKSKKKLKQTRSSWDYVKEFPTLALNFQMSKKEILFYFMDNI